MKKILFIGFLSVSLIIGLACKSSSPTTPEAKTFPTIESFSANPATINKGDTTTLSWSVKDATSVSIDQGIGTVSASGTHQVSPQASITYTLTASNNDGQRTATCSVTIQLDLPTIEYFTATPALIDLGKESTLSWSVQNATSVSIDQGIGTVSTIGTQSISPATTTTYTLTATNNDGSVTETCLVTVNTDVANVQMMSLSYDIGAGGTVFQASGRLQNRGYKIANNVILTLYFYNKDVYGGGIYLTYNWSAGNIHPLNDPSYDSWVDFVIQWDNYSLPTGWNMNRYVNISKKEYVITWQ